MLDNVNRGRFAPPAWLRQMEASNAPQARSRRIPSPPLRFREGNAPSAPWPPALLLRSLGPSRFTRFAPCARLHSLPLAGRLPAGRLLVTPSPQHRGSTTTQLRCATRMVVLPLHRLQAMPSISFQASPFGSVPADTLPHVPGL